MAKTKGAKKVVETKLTETQYRYFRAIADGLHMSLYELMRRTLVEALALPKEYK